MQIIKDGESQIRLGSETYHADADGIIDVPDEKITNRIWESGWVSAHGRQAQLAREREQQQTVTAPIAVIEAAKPKAINEKPTKDATTEKDKTL